MEFIKRNFGKLLLILFCCGMTAYWFAAPYLAADRILEAAEQGKAEQLSSFIDFPALRANLSRQLRNQINVGLMEKDGANGADAANDLSNRLVDEIVTSQGIAALLGSGKVSSKEMTADGKAAEAALAAAGINIDLMKPSDASGKPMDARYKLSEHYGDNLYQFEIELQNRDKSAKKVLISMERIGFFSWQVSNILLPFSS